MEASSLQVMNPAETCLPPELAAAVARITRDDPRYQLTRTVIRGQEMRVFANAPRSVGLLFDEAARRFADRDALVYDRDRWTYGALRRDVARLANAMTGPLGLRRGERVGIAMRNYPEFPILFLAAAAAGLVAVPLNAWWSREELTHAIGECGIRAVFADGPRADRLLGHTTTGGLRLIGVRDTDLGESYAALRDAAPEDWPQIDVDPEDDLAIMFSSGSTSFPKGVIQTHRNAISAIWSWMMGREMAAQTATPPAQPLSWLVPSPLFHVTALYANLIQGFACGAKISLMYKWDTDDAIRLIRDEHVTRVTGVPTQTADLAEAVAAQGLRFDHLDSIGGGGANRPAAQLRRLVEVFAGATPGNGWGMTETAAAGMTFYGPDYVAHPDSVGRLTPPLLDMRVIDDNGHPLPPGRVGELQIRGATVMRGYLNQPEETARSLRDGWLSTGDLVRVDETGRVYIVDRKKCIVLRGGENISCLEVENALHDHAHIAEACVFSVPDDRLGETVGAAIHAPSAAGRLGVEAITAFLRPHLAPFKMPERIWLLPGPLPRGATDKIDRTAIRAACLARGPDLIAGQ